jgi:hypothetical protein
MAFGIAATAAPSPRRKARRSSSKKPRRTPRRGAGAEEDRGVRAAAAKAPDVADQSRARSGRCSVPRTGCRARRCRSSGCRRWRIRRTSRRRRSSASSSRALRAGVGRRRSARARGNADRVTREQVRNTQVAQRKLDATTRHVKRRAGAPGGHAVPRARVRAVGAARQMTRCTDHGGSSTASCRGIARGSIARVGAAKQRAGRGDARFGHGARAARCRAGLEAVAV